MYMQVWGELSVEIIDISLFLSEEVYDIGQPSICFEGIYHGCQLVEML